ncbi:MAG: Lpg1974 family pore-forming outer membrane protein [Parachlamydiales bacterium]
MRTKKIRRQTNLGLELLIILFSIAVMLIIFYAAHRNFFGIAQNASTNESLSNEALTAAPAEPVLAAAPANIIPAEQPESSNELLVENNENFLAAMDNSSSKITKSTIDNDPHGVSAQIPPYLSIRGVIAEIDFLYWKANEDGLEYGTKMKADPIIGKASDTKTHLLDLDFEWDPGVRLSLGYLFNHDDHISVSLSWTHIRNLAHGNSKAKGIESQTGPVDTIISPWVNLLFELRAGASKAHAHWHVNYNTLDLHLARSFFLSKRVAIDPFFGFRGAWINQEYRVKYDSVFLLGEGQPLFSRDVKFKAENEFAGFGLRGGTEMLLQLTHHWHLFSQLSANIVYGQFKVRMKNLNDQGLGEGDTPPMPLNFFASESFWRVRLNFEEAIGLGWETFYQKDKYHFSFRAAYELSQWINQNQLFYTDYFRGQDTISSTPIRSQGDLSFQGIKVGMNLDF